MMIGVTKTQNAEPQEKIDLDKTCMFRRDLLLNIRFESLTKSYIISDSKLKKKLIAGLCEPSQSHTKCCYTNVKDDLAANLKPN